MTRLRRNHSHQGGGFMIRLGIMAIAIFAFAWWWGARAPPALTLKAKDPNVSFAYPLDERIDQIVDHSHYSLGYDEESEQASWVGYILRKSDLKKPRVERTDWFEEDQSVFSKSAHHRDYSGSGYSRGHLVPAADRAYSKEAMVETFFMSNISPQLRAFNGGIWRELEENVRDWAFRYDSLFVFSGPVLADQDLRKIGKSNKVAVPERFYKVLYSPSEGGVGFLMPNQLSTRPLSDFMVDINTVEEATGIDFLKDMVDEDKEEQIESAIDHSAWKYNEKRYLIRNRDWNNR